MFQSFWEWENNPLKGGTFGLTAMTRDGVLLAFGAQDLKMVSVREGYQHSTTHKAFSSQKWQSCSYGERGMMTTSI